jgi:hypothetical protein
MGHFTSYLTSLVIKLMKVVKRECKIKLMAKREVQFSGWPKKKCKLFYGQKRISLICKMGL